jgi:hypothetical protein
VEHASRYNDLLHLKVSRVMVFQSAFKIGGGATMCGARGIIMKVALRGS